MELFEKNMAAAEARHPGLHRCLAGMQPEGKFIEVPTPSGWPTLLTTVPEGGGVCLHHPDDPMQEARRLVAGYAFHGEDLTVLMGFGLGYLPMAVMEKMHRDHLLLVVEAQPQLLLTAFHLLDLSALLMDPRVKVFPAGRPEAVEETLKAVQMKILGGKAAKLIHPPVYNLSPEAYRKIEGHIERIVARIKTNFKTLCQSAPFTLENIFCNLKQLPEALPVDALSEAAEGIPAVIVAAGPSLDKNIGQLKEFSAGVAVIAVDAALGPLLAAKIVPDAVVTVDPYPINTRKFDLPSAEPSVWGRPLVFSPLVRHDIPEKFAGPKFVFNINNSISRWALSHWRPVSTFPMGFSVAHHAFYLARMMKADPILFIGLDLAFSDSKDHARHCNPTWKADFSRSDYPMGMGVDGKPVRTHPGFLDMKTLFEREIARTRAVCIDATEGGLRIDGTRIMTLKEAMAVCPVQAPGDFLSRLTNAWTSRRSSAAAGLEQQVAWLGETASSAAALCRVALEALDRISDKDTERVSCGAEKERLTGVVNAVSDRIQAQAVFMELLKDQMAEVMVHQYQMKYRMERAESEKEKRRIEIGKSSLFFRRLQEIAWAVCRHVPMDARGAAACRFQGDSKPHAPFPFQTPESTTAVDPINRSS